MKFVKGNEKCCIPLACWPQFNEIRMVRRLDNPPHANAFLPSKVGSETAIPPKVITQLDATKGDVSKG